MAYSSGVVGAEERDKLIGEGMYLYGDIADEHFGHCHYQVYPERTVPWPLLSEIYIALALYARKKGIQEGINQ